MQFQFTSSPLKAPNSSTITSDWCGRKVLGVALGVGRLFRVLAKGHSAPGTKSSLLVVSGLADSQSRSQSS